MSDDGHIALQATIAGYLAGLTEYPDRHVGGPGNRAATALFAREMAAFGYNVRRESMACIEWLPVGAQLWVRDQEVPLEVGPYSLHCDVTAPLVPVATVEELERPASRGAVVLLHGEIARHQYMPRNFRFYNPEAHQRVYRALDANPPAALVAATGRDPEMVGGQYPFPLFEDGDLDVPNACVTDALGERLLAHAGADVRVRIDSARQTAVAEHVVATAQGTGTGRIVLSAHIDSRRGSPGGLDNASGVATLLAAAGLLAGHAGTPTLEFVPFNGEDDYANPGELRWLEENTGLLDEIVFGINVDDSGQRGAINHVSFYGCPDDIERAVREAMAGYARIDEGPQWFQGDHAILAMYERPAIAIASSEMHAFMADYAHTARDTAALADPELIAETAAFIADVVRRVSAHR